MCFYPFPVITYCFKIGRHNKWLCYGLFFDSLKTFLVSPSIASRKRQAVTSSVVSVVIHPPAGTEITKATTTIRIEDKPDPEEIKHDETDEKKDEHEKKRKSDHESQNDVHGSFESTCLPPASPSLSASPSLPQYSQSYSTTKGADVNMNHHQQQHDTTQGKTKQGMKE